MLEEDYLEHKGLYAALKQWLVRAAREKGPLRVADLGCGDSEYISRVIVEAGGPALVSSYTGVDLSEPALEFSKRNMARFPSIWCPCWCMLGTPGSLSRGGPNLLWTVCTGHWGQTRMPAATGTKRTTSASRPGAQRTSTAS